MGIHHGQRRGQRRAALVVVGDDEIHADLAAVSGLIVGGDAAVHGDDEADALLLERGDGAAVEAVALLDAGGDIVDHPSALAAEKLRQKAGGSDAVHVVVAEDGDGLAPFQRRAHPRHGRSHVGQGEGILQRLVRGEKVPGFFRRIIAPGGEHGGSEGGIPGLHQRLLRLGILLLYIPDSILHSAFHPINFLF